MRLFIKNTPSLGIIFIAFLLLVSSCQKEDIQTYKEDTRNELIGVYKGVLEQSEMEYSVQTKQTSKSQEISKNHQVEILKSEEQQDAISINGVVLTPTFQKSTQQQEFKDVYIYQTLDCDGMERYKLTFYPQQQQLVLEYKHNKTCLLEKVEQNYYFRGNRVFN